MMPPTVLIQRAEMATPELAFAPVDRLALARLVSGDASAAVEHARSLAAALAGPDRDEVRLRVLAKTLASERTLYALLETVLTERVARGDARGVRTANEALRGSVVRLERLAIAHRLEATAGQRPNVVLINNAQNVQVGA